MIRLFPMQTSEAKAEYWNQYDTIAEKIANKLSLGVQDIFLANAEQIIQFALSGGNISSLPLTQEQIDEITEIVQEAYSQVVEELASDFGIEASDLSGEFGIQMSQMAYNTNSLIVESVGNFGEEMTESMKKEIMQLTSENADMNEKQLSEMLMSKYEKLSESRSKAIGRTTATSVTTGSQMLVFKDVGAQYIWMTERDSKVRASHARLDGKKTNDAGFFEMRSTYKSGDQEIVETIYIDRPVGSVVGGKPMPAREAVNCRCYLFPVLNESVMNAEKQDTSQEQENQQEKTNDLTADNLIDKPKIIKGGRGSQIEAIRNFEEKYRDLKTHEMGMATTYNGKVLFETKGISSSVTFTEEQTNFMKIDGNVVLTHNHPNDASFSFADIVGLIMVIFGYSIPPPALIVPSMAVTCL